MIRPIHLQIWHLPKIYNGSLLLTDIPMGPDHRSSRPITLLLASFPIILGSIALLLYFSNEFIDNYNIGDLGVKLVYLGD